MLIEKDRYPGVGCDVPSHSYAYTFEPNSEWDGYYARGKQIQKYFVDFADKHGLWKYMCLETQVIQATWLDGEGECSYPRGPSRNLLAKLNETQGNSICGGKTALGTKTAVTSSSMARGL